MKKVTVFSFGPVEIGVYGSGRDPQSFSAEIEGDRVYVKDLVRPGESKQLSLNGDGKIIDNQHNVGLGFTVEEAVRAYIRSQEQMLKRVSSREDFDEIIVQECIRRSTAFLEDLEE